MLPVGMRQNTWHANHMHRMNALQKPRLAFSCRFWVTPLFPEKESPLGPRGDRCLASAPPCPRPAPASCLPTQDLRIHCPFAWNVLTSPRLLVGPVCAAGMCPPWGGLSRRLPVPSMQVPFPLALAEEGW